jgi:hypothetical protein
MLLNKMIDTLVLGAAKDKDNVYALNHVMIGEKRAYAGNGHSLYWADVMSSFSEDDYPERIEGSERNSPTFPALIPRTAIEKAIKNRPKVGSNASLAILETIQLSEQKNGTSSRVFELNTTDLNTFDSVGFKTSNDESYPDAEAIINMTAKDGAEVQISIDELELLVKMVKKSGEASVRIKIIGEFSPVAVSAFGLNGAIMPLRLAKK